MQDLYVRLSNEETNGKLYKERKNKAKMSSIYIRYMYNNGELKGIYHLRIAEYLHKLKSDSVKKEKKTHIELEKAK